MTFNVSEVVLNTEAEAFISLMDSGTVEFRTGAQPASTGDAATGTLLGTLSLPTTALTGAASGGTAELAATTATQAIAAGAIGWARVKDSGANVIFDGTVTLSGGGGDIIATEVDVLLDDLINILSVSYTRS